MAAVAALSLPPPLPPPPTSTNLWWLGVIFCIISTFITTTGLVITKVSAGEDEGVPFYRKWKFWMGMGLSGAGEITLTPLAFMFAPLSIVAPMGGVCSIILTIAYARFGCFPGLQKEDLAPEEYAAIGVILIGVTMSTIFGAHNEPDLSFEGLNEVIVSAKYGGYVGIVGGASLLLLLLRLDWWESKEANTSPCGPCVQFVVRKIRPDPRSTFTCVAAASIASLSATACQIALKALSKAVRNLATGAHAVDLLRSGSVWLSLGVIAGPTGVGQVILINAMNEAGDASLGLSTYAARDAAPPLCS